MWQLCTVRNTRTLTGIAWREQFVGKEYSTTQRFMEKPVNDHASMDVLKQRAKYIGLAKFLGELIWEESFGTPARALKSICGIALWVAGITLFAILVPVMFLSLVGWFLSLFIWHCPGTIGDCWRDGDRPSVWQGVRYLIGATLALGTVLLLLWWCLGQPDALSNDVLRCAAKQLWNRCSPHP